MYYASHLLELLMCPDLFVHLASNVSFQMILHCVLGIIAACEFTLNMYGAVDWIGYI